jgi:EAL domain-containing protein (putative c-di-GMP-specific phosphodiesterase class I)
MISLLARHLEMDTVAEGIENREQLLYLRGIGCEFGQGYLFSRPLPEHEAERLLELSVGTWRMDWSECIAAVEDAPDRGADRA